MTFPEAPSSGPSSRIFLPEALNGATLFHEHLDGVYSRDTRQLKLPPPSSADITPVIADVKEAMKTGAGLHRRRRASRHGGELRASEADLAADRSPRRGERRLLHSEHLPGRNLDDERGSRSPRVSIKEAATGRYGAYGEIGDMPDEADFTPDERKVFRAVGKAHLKTNLPIFTHNNYGTGPRVPRDIALRQLDVYESVGVDPRRMAVGHVDSLPGKDPDIMKAIARRGAFVGIDRVRGDGSADADRVALVLDFSRPAMWTTCSSRAIHERISRGSRGS